LDVPQAVTCPGKYLIALVVSVECIVNTQNIDLLDAKGAGGTCFWPIVLKNST
jgi:hypothetical protein